MFRRKEDSLFDTTTDPNQPQDEMESVTLVSSPSSSSSMGLNSSPGISASHSGPGSVPPALRNMQENRMSQPAQHPQSANSFRPNTPAPMSNDLTRNRMPENKSMSSMSSPSSSSSSSSSSSMMASAANKSGKRVLTVGNDILLKGEIATCDRLVIEGKVDATLNDVHTVEIAETGSFKGAAHIEDAEISGLFEGDLIVRNRLVIYATGKVRGKITYGEIEIERGGELTGEIKTTNSQAQQSSARPSRPGMKEDNKYAA